MNDHLQEGARRRKQFVLLVNPASCKFPRLPVGGLDALCPVLCDIEDAIGDQGSDRQAGEDDQPRADAAKIARRSRRYVNGCNRFGHMSAGREYNSHTVHADLFIATKIYLEGAVWRVD
jgi:hypothetical protein